MRILVCIAGMAAMCLAVGNSHGATITLTATNQTWIASTTSGNYRTTPRNTDTTMNVHSGSGASNASTSNTVMYGVLEFDLSLVPGTITDAVLQLYMDPGQQNKAPGTTSTQVTHFVPLMNPAYPGSPNAGPTAPPWSPPHLDSTQLTYNNYVPAGSFGPTDFSTSQFGTITFSGTGGAVPVSAYTQTTNANATDLQYFDGIQASTFPYLGLLLVAPGTGTGTNQIVHNWSDNGAIDPTNGLAHPPQLIVTYAPEPSTFAMASVMGIAGLIVMRRKRRQ